MPRPVAIYYHPDSLMHDTGPGHPERAERMVVCHNALKAAPFTDQLHWHEPQPAPAKWIESIHTPEYRQFIEEACLAGKHFLDTGDTVICPDSYRAAILAAGGAINAIDAVLQNGYAAAFSLSRPPGHHAGVESPMGFCLFNNIAIAAEYAEKTYGMERICILDFDVHHGNGTQDIFYGSPSVLFCSLHQLPLWPHSGESFETGSKAGKGLTLNCPFPNGAGIDLYMEALNSEVLPKISDFEPELLLVSAGFDGHKADPLADVHLLAEDFHTITKWILQVAETYTHGRMVSFLEGGYDLEALAASVCAHVQALVEGA
ncbi:MAG: histone deacetylase [Puniceicoccaceae bacterium]